MKLIYAVALLACSSAQAGVIYDTFNEEDQNNLFDCCNTLSISGSHSDANTRASVAIPFSPEVFAKIREVDIALSSAHGNDALEIEIVGSENGLPGKMKKEWVRVPPLGGQCCTIVAMTSSIIHAGAGGHFWILVRGKKHAVGGWNLNTLGLSGPYAVAGDDGVWTMTEGPLPAVRIITK